MMEGETRRVEGYTIYKKIGQGGFSEVYKGMDMNNKPVAAKKMKLNSLHDGTEMLKFFNDPPKHRNIIEVLRTVFLGDECWMVMPFCEHGDLNNYFAKNTGNHLDTRLKLTIMQQMAEGLSFLHGKNIVHRDIKPGNILVRESADVARPHIVIADFNLCKYLNADDSSSGMSSNVGTMTYKAPEFFITNPDVQVWYHRNVDTFACGLTYLSMMQHQNGQKLLPSMEHSMGNPGQLEAIIGFQMACRQRQDQPSLDIVKNKPADSYLVKGMKEVIRKMTQVVPEHRLHMDEVVWLLNNEHHLEDMGQVMFTFFS